MNYQTATQVAQERDQHVSWLRDCLTEEITHALAEAATNGPDRDYRRDAVRIVMAMDAYFGARRAA